jgi:putative membrane-bound dehydrogenase-like protein
MNRKYPEARRSQAHTFLDGMDESLALNERACAPHLSPPNEEREISIGGFRPVARHDNFVNSRKLPPLLLWRSGPGRAGQTYFDLACWIVGTLALVFFCFSSLAIDGPLTPAQSLEYLKAEPGLKVELVASEPMVIDPVAVAWDEKGRMYVVEDRGYPVGPGKGQPPAGQVVLLEDTRGDGKYDKRTVFADGLTFPNGVMPWKGGVYVTCAPYLYYFKDTNGDGKADIKEIVFKGFQDLSTTQLRVSHPTLALDNWVYLTSGLTAAKVTSPAHPDRPAVFLNRVDGRFRPGTDILEETSGTAQFGQTFDRFGRKFICSNRNHVQEVVLQTGYLKRNPYLTFSQTVEDIPDHEAACRVYPLSADITTAAFHAGYITSACGITIFQGTAMPEKYLGNSFTCEPAGNLVHHDVLVTNGVTYIAKRAYHTNEFLASPDNWFRPVNLANGPDGALYVCDMYRKTIEHPEYLPEATRKVTDFESGKTMGRIYRIVGTNAPAHTPKKFDLSKDSIRQLCNEFENPNIWWRSTAQRLLLERHDNKAIPFLQKLSHTGNTPEARVHSLRMLEALDGLDEEVLLRALNDKSAGVREHGIALSESRLTNSPDLAKAVRHLAFDDNTRVRFQCALSLGVVANPEIVPGLSHIVLADLDDKWTRAAVLSSISGQERAFLEELLDPRVVNVPSTNGLQSLMGEMGHILAASQPYTELPAVLQQLIKPRYPADLAWHMAALAGFSDGLRARPAAASEHLTIAAVAQYQPALRQNLDQLFSRASAVAGDSTQPINDRLAAIGLLAQANGSDIGPTLQAMLDPHQPSEIQTAAIRAIGRSGDSTAGTALVQPEHWNAYTPAVRDIVLSAVMVNTDYIRALLASIEQGGIPAWTVNADRRSQLMRHKDESIRQRADAVFKELVGGDRMNAYEESKPVLALKGDSRNGHLVFEKNCTPCHVFAGEGYTVGPDLTGIRNQPAEVILLHIVVPEYEIVPIYTCYNLETKGGQSYTGLLAKETPVAITLRMAQAVEQQIPRSDIASMTTSRLSLMPQELEKAMTKQELADLLAFLKGQ